MRSIWKRVGHRRHVHSLLKISDFHSWKNSVKRILNPYSKRYANPFEIDESDIVLAAPKILLADSDHDDNEQDEIDILPV